MLKTIKVKADTDLGYMFVNKSDFDSNVHTCFSEGFVTDIVNLPEVSIDIATEDNGVNIVTKKTRRTKN